MRDFTFCFRFSFDSTSKPFLVLTDIHKPARKHHESLANIMSTREPWFCCSCFVVLVFHYSTTYSEELISKTSNKNLKKDGGAPRNKSAAHISCELSAPNHRGGGHFWRLSLDKAVVASARLKLVLNPQAEGVRMDPIFRDNVSIQQIQRKRRGEKADQMKQMAWIFDRHSLLST